MSLSLIPADKATVTTGVAGVTYGAGQSPGYFKDDNEKVEGPLTWPSHLISSSISKEWPHGMNMKMAHE